ncbi:hypothetical protein BDR22DRAFT_922704 [Usnea florida]
MGRKSVPWALRPGKNKTLYLALLYFSYSVSAILSPSSVANGTGNAYLSLLLPAKCRELIKDHPSVSTLGAPVSPPDFEVDISYDTRIILNPLAVYSCAIGCMYNFAQLGWDKPLARSITYWPEGYNVQIGIESTQGSHGSVHLATNHIVIGLYMTMLDVAALSRFCEVHTTLSQHQRRIGRLLIEKKTSSTLEQGGTNATNTTLEKGSMQGSVLTYPSGRIIDPVDSNFQVVYTYSGARLNSRDVFLAVLDALATAAQFDRLAFFESLSVTSPSGACTISIVAIQSSTFKVNYSFFTRALFFMIRDIMVYLKNFGELTLRLEWKRSAMAEVSVKSADHRPTAQ